jgi:hypothetical protein
VTLNLSKGKFLPGLLDISFSPQELAEAHKAINIFPGNLAIYFLRNRVVSQFLLQHSKMYESMFVPFVGSLAKENRRPFILALRLQRHPKAKQATRIIIRANRLTVPLLRPP